MYRLKQWLPVIAALVMIIGLKVSGDSKKLPPIPPGAKVTLETDQTEYFLGESVQLHFILHNTGTEPFTYSHGGDYRGINRHLRFKFRVFDEKGNELPDPFPDWMCHGGLGETPTLKPDDTATFSLLLFRYWYFDKPGIYTIRVHHDFGWDKNKEEYPWAEIKLTLKMPNDAEAERIVGQLDQLAKLPEESAYSEGKRHKPFADWSGLRYDVYLKPLLKRVRSHPQRYLDGISVIPTAEATLTLVKLTAGSSGEFRLRAANLLVRRINNQYQGALKFPSSQEGYAATFAAQAESPDLRGTVRALGKELIQDTDRSTVAAGARLLQHVAQLEDAAAILDALDKALEITVSPRTGERANPLNFPSPVMELLNTANALCQRGYQPENNLSGSARFLIYFHHLSLTHPDPMPDNWLKILDTFGRDSSYAIRERALASIPSSVPDNCVKYVQRAFEDPDAGVLFTACKLATSSKRREFFKPLLEVLQTTHQRWIVQQAADGACALNGQYEASLICANRLPEDGFLSLSLDVLARNIDGIGGGHSGRTDLSRGERLAIRDAWRQFLTANAAELKSGKRFHYQDPAVSRALFGRSRAWQLPDGSFWPMSPMEQSNAPAR